MIGAGLFGGGGHRRLTRSGLRHENTQLRHDLATVTAERDQLAAGIGRANTRAEEAEQRALTAEAEFRRIAGRPCGPDAETTVPMRQPDVPALRDVAAELGCGTPLRDTDPAWRDAHQSARKPTQACERPSGVDAMTDPNLPPDESPGDWVNTSRDGWRPKPNPDGDGETTQELAAPGPDTVDTTNIHVVAVPYHDPANPAA